MAYPYSIGKLVRPQVPQVKDNANPRMKALKRRMGKAKPVQPRTVISSYDY